MPPRCPRKNRVLAGVLKAVVDFCSACLSAGISRRDLSPGSRAGIYRANNAFISKLRDKLPLATRLAKAETNASLESNMGYYMLWRCLTGAVTKRDWIAGYNTASQRHVIRKEEEGRYTHLNLMMVCFWAIEQLAKGEFEQDMFDLHLTVVNCTELNFLATKSLFEGQDDFLGQYWTATVLFGVLGITLEDLSSHTVTCPVCFESLAIREMRNTGSAVKLGVILACRHVVCKQCFERLGEASCPTCREPLLKHPVQSAITGGYMPSRGQVV